MGREVYARDPLIAILTILGFSLYDTVVIFDKIKENTEAPALLTRHGYAGVVNLSLNQVLMRSVNTSLVVLLPILSLPVLRRRYPQGLRVRDVRGRGDRGVLLHLRRGAGVGRPEGARAQVSRPRVPPADWCERNETATKAAR